MKGFKHLSIIMCAFIFQAGCDSNAIDLREPKQPDVSAEDKALSELKSIVEEHENADERTVVDWEMQSDTSSVRTPFKAEFLIVQVIDNVKISVRVNYLYRERWIKRPFVESDVIEIQTYHEGHGWDKRNIGMIIDAMKSDGRLGSVRIFR
jgi:hypothetical protein